MQRHRALLGELERVGQQVLQHLSQALRVGVQRGGSVGGDGGGERQALLLRQRAQRVDQGLQGFGQRHRFHRHGGLAGLDLGQVEDVVDEGQQVVACRVDGLRVLHLLGAQVARLVVRQQLGQDQGGVERRAQLVAHVGQKLALVLAGQLQLAGLVRHGALGAQQLLALVFQLLGLGLQVGVGLLQLGLLHLHLGLRFLKDAALLLQLFVVDAQLLLLRLQLFRLALGFFQQRLQSVAVDARADGHGQHFRGALQQRALGVAHGPVKAQLDDGIHLTPFHGRRQQQLAGVGLPGAGGHRQITRRHIAHMQQLARARGLPDQAFVEQQLLGQPLARQCIATKQREAAFAVSHITCPHRGLEVGGQIFQRQLADVFQTVVALDALPQAAQPCRNPGLLGLAAVFARRESCRQADQHQQDPGAAGRVQVGVVRRVGPLLAPCGQLLVLQHAQVFRQLGQARHGAFPRAGMHQPDGAHCIAVLAHGNRVIELAQLDLRELV